MKNFLVSFYYLFPAIIAIILVLLTPIPTAQLTTSENRILLQVQKLLEYPQVLQEWTNFTNFCYLPPSPSIKILCSNGHVTELNIIGNRTKPVSSERFSMDSLFTALTKLSNLKVLSLVSLGLWGPLPSKINRFISLEVMNLSSNSIFGEIPSSISSLKNLRSLILADNMISENVPDLGRLTSLEEINFSFNKLGPEFLSLSKNLVRIMLKNNSFRCSIPTNLTNDHKLQTFDISSNEITGNIPSFLFSLPSLQYLNLASNQLSGSISMNTSCSSALTFVDISHNFLVGKLPSCVGSKSSNRTVLYSGNCLLTGRLSDQHPSSYCKKLDALAVKPPHRREKKEWKVQLGLIVGVIGGVVGISVILVMLICFILKKPKAEERADSYMDKSAADKVSALANPSPNINTKSVPQPQRLTVLGFPPYNTFTLEEIEDATNNFDPSNLISEGSQGQLYKGWLRDGSKVMINHVKLKQKNLSKNTVQNLKVLPYLKHRHLVSVLGHCLISYQDRSQTTSTLFIVFEHVSNVSLRDYLTDRRKKEMLKWPQRMAISTCIARGIQFLHTGVNPGIFGNNIKIENILLDDSLNAKLSGYSIPFSSKKGLDSKLSEQSAPNDAEKEDIYQLGVILLEVITGKPITSSSEVEELKNELGRGLSEAGSPILWGASDPSFRGTCAHESLRTAIQITISCLSNLSTNRPSIEDILWNLQYSVQVQEGRTSSGNLNTKF